MLNQQHSARLNSQTKKSLVVPAANLGARQATVDAIQQVLNDNKCSDTATQGENPICTTKRAELQTAKDALGTAQKDYEAATPTPPDSCSGTDFFTNFTNCIYQGLVGVFSTVIITLGGSILYFSALLFDYSLWWTVIAFSDVLKTGGAAVGATGDSSSPIYSVWVIVRNLFNIVIVFQLLRIAIYKILSSVVSSKEGSSAVLKRTLSSIIVFTLFVNFSFFFTKVLVDFSNIASLQFYSALGAEPGNGEWVRGNTGVAIMESMGIQSAIFDSGKNKDGINSEAAGDSVRGSFNNTDTPTQTLDKSFFGNIVLFVLLLLAAFIMVQGTIIFTTRSVMLIILLIGSPLMFASGIFGPLDRISGIWWKKFLEQLYVAPVYLAMLYLTVKMAGGGTKGGLLNQIKGTGTFGTDSTLSIVFPAIIMGALFIAVVSVSKKVGGSAAEKSSAFGAKAFGAVVGGAGGLAARKSIGRVANRFSNSQKWQDRAAAGGLSGFASKQLLNIADRGKNSTFDLRNSSAVNKLDGVTGGRLGLKGLGAGAAGGFVAERAASDKARKDEMARKAALLQEDTYGMTEDQKKAAEMRNQDRIERYNSNKSLPYSGKETGGDFVGKSKDIQKGVLEIDGLQSNLDAASRSLKSAELSRDPEKIAKAKVALKESKKNLNEAVEGHGESMRAFFENEVAMNTDLAKILENTKDMEEGDVKNAAVRRNMQRIADFKSAQEGWNPAINKGLRGVQSAWSTATKSSSPMARSQTAWESAAKTIRKETVRKRAAQEAEDLLKILAWKEDHENIDPNNNKDMPAMRTEQEIVEILKARIANSDSPRKQAVARGAQNRLKPFLKNELESGATTTAPKAPPAAT